MAYKILTQVGSHYSGEDGRPSPYRQGVLEDVAEALRASIKLANDARVPAPKPIGGSVSSIKAYYESENTRVQRLKLLEEDVFKIRRQLARLGAIADPEGNLNLGKSAKVIHYDSALERELTRIVIEGGRMLYAKTRKPLDTGKMTTSLSDDPRDRVRGNRRGMYVMSAQGHFHVSTQVVGQRHHSSLLAGGNVACAGELEVTDGRLVMLSNDSGHYQPDIDHLLQVLHQLVTKDHVLPTFRIKVFDGTNEVFYTDLADFLVKNGLDDQSYDYRSLVAGYGAHLGDAALLAGNDWVFRPGTGVFTRAGAAVPHRDVRHWLRANGHVGVAAVATR